MPTFALGTLVPDMPCHPSVPLGLCAAMARAVAAVESARAAGLDRPLHHDPAIGSVWGRFTLALDERGRATRVGMTWLRPGEPIEGLVALVHAGVLSQEGDEEAMPNHLVRRWMQAEVERFHAEVGRPLAHLYDGQVEELARSSCLGLRFPEAVPFGLHDHWLAAFARAERERRVGETWRAQRVEIERAEPIHDRLVDERHEASAWAQRLPTIAADLGKRVLGRYLPMDRQVIARRCDRMICEGGPRLLFDGDRFVFYPL